MKKKIILAVCAVLLILSLIPIPMHLKDGGTVVYKSVLYEVQDIERMKGDGHFEVGFSVKILGFDVFEKTSEEVRCSA